MITEGTSVLWKESAYYLRTTFQYFAESFDGGKSAFGMRHSFLYYPWYAFPNLCTKISRPLAYGVRISSKLARPLSIYPSPHLDFFRHQSRTRVLSILHSPPTSPRLHGRNPVPPRHGSTQTSLLLFLMTFAKRSSWRTDCACLRGNRKPQELTAGKKQPQRQGVPQISPWLRAMVALSRPTRQKRWGKLPITKRA